MPGTHFQRYLMFLIKQYYYTYLLQCKYLPGRNTLAYFTKLSTMFCRIVNCSQFWKIFFFYIYTPEKWVCTFVPRTHFQPSLMFLFKQYFMYLQGRNTTAYFPKMFKMFYDLVMYSQFWKTVFFDIDALAKWVSTFVPGTHFQHSLMFLF